MQRLKCVAGHYLDLSEYGITDKFDVYELGTYDFTDNLDFGESAGVYIFTCRDMLSTTSKKYHKETYLHELIYCGMTKQLNQRFYSHFHADDIQAYQADRISIHKCKNEEEAKKLEKLVLSKLSFPVNEQLNGNPKFPEIKKVEEAF